MTKLSLVLLQLDVVFGDPKANRQNVSEWFAKANLQPNEFVLLPELWDTGYDLKRLPEIADREGKTAQAFLAGLAKQYQVFISGGSIARQVADKVFNTTYVVAPTGEILTRYDKVHLFRLMEEEKFLHAGNQLAQTNIADFSVAPFICYDLRFPEWFRKSANEGTDLLVLSAQWPTPRIAHWEKLVQARAIENQCFVAAVNRVGADPNNQFGGHSLVVDPLGNSLLQLDDSETIGRVMISQDAVVKTRGQIPVFEDRRTELY
ncbi:carbon-nitrogen family hydrolase [Enterococcus saccharolyticus]|uniref:carbon-nitrogen family hydrolase n=1 Tax=Enterococcus saccharolyticus TaxID=41997 RepID=UPI0039E1CDC6